MRLLIPFQRLAVVAFVDGFGSHVRCRHVRVLAERSGAFGASVCGQFMTGRRFATRRQIPSPSELEVEVTVGEKENAEEAENAEEKEKENALLNHRLCRIVQGLRDVNIADPWRTVLNRMSTGDLTAKLLPLIPTAVKHILAATGPPAPSRLKTVEWRDTSSMGVYAFLFKSQRTESLNNTECYYLYVGSATKHEWGLAGRRQDHEWNYRDPSERKEEATNLSRRIPDSLRRAKKRKWFSRFGSFHTLLEANPVVPVSPGTGNDKPVTETAQLVLVAEAVLTAWLGGFYVGDKIDGEHITSEERRLMSLCPWDMKDVAYEGISSHSPPVMDYMAPMNESDERVWRARRRKLDKRGKKERRLTTRRIQAMQHVNFDGFYRREKFG